ncbi:MAG: acyltransferase [Acidimicrobiales bacterium]|nr:acyltransferase [Acidimicrobiales bacterium]
MDRLSPLDVSFLHMEDADRSAHMHIASIGIFEGPVPAHHEITAAFADRLHLIPRYRQRVERVPLQLARPVWVDATDFDVDYHVRRTALAAPGGEAELSQLVGRIVSQRLDRTKPLWEIWVVEGLADGHWATIGKVHHCMVDGVSGAELMVVLLDLTPEITTYGPVEWEPQPIGTGEVVRDAVRSLATDSVEQVRALRRAVRRPAQVLHEVREVVSGVRSMSGAVKTQGDGELTGPIGSHRVVAWADASLDDVKAVRAGLGGTVNDVVLAAITNGFRRLLVARGDEVDGRVVRTLVPVSVRGTRDDGAAAGDGSFDNKVSAMFAALPVGLDDPVERLAAIRTELADLKESKQALAGEALTSLAGVAPAALLALGARVAGRAVASGPTPIQTVTTNVPGPQLPLYSLGRKMVRAYPYVPVAAPVRISVAIFSYDGTVTFSVTGDRDTSPDIDIVAAGITDGIAELVKLATPSKPVRRPAKRRAAK